MLSDEERKALVKQRLMNLASGVKKMVSRNQEDNTRKERELQSRQPVKRGDSFVGIGTFEKRVGVDKTVRELHKERMEKYKSRISNVREGLSSEYKSLFAKPKGKSARKNLNIKGQSTEPPKIWG